MTHAEILAAAGLTKADLTGGTLPVRSPIDGADLAQVHETKAEDMPAIIARPGCVGSGPSNGRLLPLSSLILASARASAGLVTNVPTVAP